MWHILALLIFLLVILCSFHRSSHRNALQERDSNYSELPGKEREELKLWLELGSW